MMMETIKFFIMGLIQGATEFLPVSSSGHLVLGKHFLGIKSPGIVLEVLLHLATLLAVIIVFRRDILNIISSVIKFRKDEDFHLGMFIIIGSIPTAIIGILFEDFFESLFQTGTLYPVAGALMVNGLVLSTIFFMKKRTGTNSASKSLVIGIFQGMAIIPGISRSGSTIFSAMLMNIKPEKAFRFSFLLSLPAVFGATLLKARDISETALNIDYTVGFTGALISGLFSLYLLRKAVEKGKLHYFGVYCIILALLLIGVGS